MLKLRNDVFRKIVYFTRRLIESYLTTRIGSPKIVPTSSSKRDFISYLYDSFNFRFRWQGFGEKLEGGGGD